MMFKILKKQNSVRQFSTVYTADKPFPDIFSDLRNHGYLPKLKPLRKLPSEFGVVNEMLDKMTFHQPDGTKGLLAKDLLRKTVDSDLPNMMDQINKVDARDSHLCAALFRDYSMLSAGYLLESCHLSFLKTKDYGLGSPHLPEQLAIPMKALCDKIQYG